MAAVKSEDDISVIICTRNRANSLRETLRCLSVAQRGPLRCGVVIVDNASSDDTANVAKEFSDRLPIHYLYESRPGKGHALNRALDEAPLGRIVAVLDDDMSPHEDWFLGVKRICDRWPDKDYFTGRSHIVWPAEKVPSWCQHPGLQGWAYSVMGGPTDKPVAAGRWFSGNHFWFRKRVIQDGRRFGVEKVDLRTHMEVPEPYFMLQLAEDGFGGISGPDAVCGHRVQPELLTSAGLKRRALRAGRAFGRVRLSPYKSSVRQARLFRDHPVVARLYCIAALLGWGMAYILSFFGGHLPSAIELRLKSMMRCATYDEYLRVANTMAEYRVFGRRQ